jgi:SOS response regulatory protein OraA/RecX
MEKKQEAADAVLSLIAAKPQLSHEVREELVKRGFTGSEVRTAVANLWDEGRLNVGLDQRLRSTDPGKT